ncbi:hypothetical protein D3C71_2249910 [compost metagenome]
MPYSPLKDTSWLRTGKPRIWNSSPVPATEPWPSFTVRTDESLASTSAMVLACWFWISSCV